MKVDITHLAMKVDFQASDHFVAMEKKLINLFQQNVLKCISLTVTSDFTYYGRY